VDPSKHRRRGAETKRPLPQARADALAANLDVDLDCGICHACLSFVSFAIDRGDPDEIARETRRITPDLWYEGLAEPALAAVRRAYELGVRDAEEALAELERRGARSAVARAIVRRLAEELSRRARTEVRLEALARDRLRLAPPELN
jgi:hypothetical protein